MNILLTAGPIPAKIDSVKYITNRFKGGLALKTAQALASQGGHDVTIVAWKYTDFETNLPVIKVDDVYDYYHKVLENQYDAYILGAAVANLGPVTPYRDKFPSHLYKEGDYFNIQFKIMPRVIDTIKKKYPRSTLIGYKLYDGSDDELIEAARHTLYNSKANLVFANHPAWAKERKIAVTPDGSAFQTTFDKHIDLILRLLNEKFYTTEIRKSLANHPFCEFDLLDNYPKTVGEHLTYGTFALRYDGNQFITTARGKKTGELSKVFVESVDHGARTVVAGDYASLNAPALHSLLASNSDIMALVHGHADLDVAYDYASPQYEFPGTSGDIYNLTFNKDFIIKLKHHGYIAGFKFVSDCWRFLDKYGELG
jgi:hypothetical protein